MAAFDAQLMANLAEVLGGHCARWIPDDELMAISPTVSFEQNDIVDVGHSMGKGVTSGDSDININNEEEDWPIIGPKALEISPWQAM